jgi:methionyl-tRNA formyltransferase
MVSWEMNAADIYDLWRAVYPWHELYAHFGGSRLYLSMAMPPEKISPGAGSLPGDIISVSNESITIMASDGPIRFNKYHIGNLSTERSCGIISKEDRKCLRMT